MIKVIKEGCCEKEVEKGYPKLMKGDNSNMIILFVDSGRGTVIDPNGSSVYDVGDNGAVWDVNYFSDYNEPITIQNA